MDKDTITLGFFKTFEKDNDDVTWFGKMIGFYTHGPYSHVAVLIQDEDCGPISNTIQWEADPISGYVINSEHIFDNTKWEYIIINVNNLDNIKKFLNLVLGNKYDYMGILGFILPIQDRSNKWFCSELASNILKIDGQEFMWSLDPSTVSPNKLYKLLNKAFDLKPIR